MTEGSAPRRRADEPASPVWEGLPSDAWAEVLVAVRAELSTRAEPTAAEQAVLDAPTSRLVARRGRAQVIALLTEDPALAAAVHERLASTVRTLLAPSTPPPPAARPAATTPAAPDEERLRARIRRALGERDEWQRRAQGAQAQVTRLEREVESLRRTLADRDTQLAALEQRLATSDEERVRAVERERRRRDGEVSRLEDQLAKLRRAEQERRAAARRAQAAPAEPARSAPPPEPPARLTPGRPTVLPRSVAPDTTEAARLLLGSGRLVLIDGYNVTRTHRDDLDLEGQRTWLVQRCVTAAASLRVRPVVVFDGQRAGASRPTVARQQVEVRFTPEGISADDELVLAVEATDEPVVVVTDDRELRDRVRASGADVIGTLAFLGVVGR